MSNINDGGPAFPFPTDRFHDGEMRAERSEGMTLRDYFAAKAMSGFNREMVAYEWGNDVRDMAARNAYALADAMLKARDA